MMIQLSTRKMYTTVKRVKSLDHLVKTVHKNNKNIYNFLTDD